MRRSIQMPEWLNQELKQIAARRGVSVNALIIESTDKLVNQYQLGLKRRKQGEMK